MAAASRPASRVDPVPGLSGGQHVEGAASAVPVLEGRDLDGECMTDRDLGHATIRLDTDHRTPSFSAREAADAPGATRHQQRAARRRGGGVREERGGLTRRGPAVRAASSPNEPGPNSSLGRLEQGGEGGGAGGGVGGARPAAAGRRGLAPPCWGGAPPPDAGGGGPARAFGEGRPRAGGRTPGGGQ